MENNQLKILKKATGQFELFQFLEVLLLILWSVMPVTTLSSVRREPLPRGRYILFRYYLLVVYHHSAFYLSSRLCMALNRRVLHS